MHQDNIKDIDIIYKKKNFEKIKIKNEFIFLQTHYSDNYSDKLNIGFT